MRTPETTNMGKTNAAEPKKRCQAVQDRPQDQLREHVDDAEEGLDPHGLAPKLPASHPVHAAEERADDDRGEDEREALATRESPIQNGRALRGGRMPKTEKTAALTTEKQTMTMSTVNNHIGQRRSRSPHASPIALNRTSGMRR